MPDSAGVASLARDRAAEPSAAPEHMLALPAAYGLLDAGSRLATDLGASDGVAIWTTRVDGGADTGNLLELLDGQEQARADRFRFERDRARFVARRAFLRKVLAGYAGVPPARIRYATSPMGKPGVVPSLGVSFSTSHADGLAIVAVARDRLVGIDLERVRPIPDALDLAQLFFSRREYEHLRSTTEALRSEAFLRLWTRKESYAKAVGGGMSIPFDEFEVLGIDNGWTTWHRVANGREQFVVASVDVLAGYVASVAVAGTPGTLTPVTHMSVLP